MAWRVGGDWRKGRDLIGRGEKKRQFSEGTENQQT